MSDDLICASKNGCFEKVVSLITLGYSVHLRDKDNATALYWSCCRGHIDISKKLIECGSDVNAQVTWGSTALHAACDRGHAECAKILIHSGANIHAQNKQGDSGLHVAAYRGHVEIVKLLIKHDANLFLKNHKGKTAAEEAEGNNHRNTANWLFKRMKESLERGYTGGEDSAILSCPEQFGREIADDLRSFSTNTSSLPESFPVRKGDYSKHFVQYNSDITDFKRPNNIRYGRDGVSASDPCVNTIHTENKHPKVLSRRQSINNSRYHTFDKRRHSPQEGLDVHDLLPVALNSENDSDKTPQNTKLENGDNPLHGDHHRTVDDSHKLFRHEKPNYTVEQIVDTLQLQLVDSNESVLQMEKKVREMENTIKDLHMKNNQYKFVCNRLYNEKKTLEAVISQGERSDIRQRGCSMAVDPRPTTVVPEVHVTHEHILASLKLGSEKNMSLLSSDETLFACKEILRTKYLAYASQLPLCSRNTEWHPGTDYVLLGEKPIYHVTDGRQGSIIMKINHKGNIYMLKIIISLTDIMGQQQDSFNMDKVLSFQYGAEFNIPTEFQHPNIVKIRHYYIGSSDRFRKFESILFPQSVDNTVEMTRRTLFLVTDHYPHTLSSLIQSQQSLSSQTIDATRDKFLFHLLYQLLSALEYLQRSGIVHRDLKPESIFVDHYLRPVIADFGMAIKVIDAEGKHILFTQQHQLLSGNIHSLAPELLRLHQSTDTLDSRVTLYRIYEKTDVYAIGSIFYSILHPSLDSGILHQPSAVHTHFKNGDIPQLSPCYSEGLRWILSNLVRQNPADRLTARSAMLHIGVLMMSIKQDELRSENEARHYCHAQMLKLLALQVDKEPSGDCVLTLQESVDLMESRIQADFMLNVSPKELYDVYQMYSVRSVH